jgi:hypothetical protein
MYVKKNHCHIYIGKWLIILNMKSIFFTKNVEGGVFINSSCTCDRVKNKWH